MGWYIHKNSLTSIRVVVAQWTISLSCRNEPGLSSFWKRLEESSYYWTECLIWIKKSPVIVSLLCDGRISCDRVKLGVERTEKLFMDQNLRIKSKSGCRRCDKEDAWSAFVFNELFLSELYIMISPVGDADSVVRMGGRMQGNLHHLCFELFYKSCVCSERYRHTCRPGSCNLLAHSNL